MLTPKLHIIFNPASSGGKTGEHKDKIIKEIENHFGNNYSLLITQKQYDAICLTQKAINEKCKSLIVVGGDGTIQEVVNGLMNYDKDKLCSLGIVSCGTGQGFALSLNLPKSIKEQLQIIKSGFTKKVDVGRILNENKNTRYFINEFQAGIGGAVVKNVNGNLKRKGGKLAFGIGTLYTVFQYHNPKIKLIIDDSLEFSEELTGIVIANGRLTGGGMQLAPSADLSDGLLDLLLMRKQTSLQRIMIFPKIYSGKHIHSPLYSYQRIKKIKISAEEYVPIEADGEILDSLPVEVDVIPSALSVFVNKN